MKAPSHATVVAYVALFFAMTGTAVAATGGTFLLGRGNTASAPTTLSNTGGGPVLSLSGRTGQPPLAASSGSGKATNLDADKLDGLDSTTLQRRIKSSCLGGSAITTVGGDGSITCTAASDGPSSLPALYRRVEPTVVVISCETAAGVSQGSGFAFSSETGPEAAARGYNMIILTNEHVVADCESSPKSAFVSQNGRKMPSELWNWDQVNDVASLMATASIPTLPVAPRAPEIGSWAAALGAPLGIEGTVTAGVVSNIDRGGNLLLSDVSITHGNSGGPLVNRDGKFLGFTEAMLTTGAGANDGESTNLIVAPDALCAKVLACFGSSFWPADVSAHRQAGGAAAGGATAGTRGGRYGSRVGPPRRFL